MVLERVGGRALNRAEIIDIYKRQQKPGRFTTQEEQLNLRRTMLERIRANHPQGVPALPYDLTSPAAQEIRLTSTVAQTYKLDRYLDQFRKVAPQATAGLRENFDVLDWNNPNFMYNPMFTALLIEGEARFIKELHAQKVSTKLNGDLAAKAAEVEKSLSPETLRVVREVFGGRSLVEILTLLRDKPLKVMGKEVRSQTDHMLELEARIMAANDITVITTENYTETTNIYLISFLCFLLGSDGGTYYTPSHSSVYVLGRKALAGNGAQLLPDVYKGFIRHLDAIMAEAQTTGYSVRIAEADNPSILRTLSYERVSSLFNQALSPDPKVVATINEAAAKGFRVTLNTLCGSAAKSLMAQFKAFGINTDIFEPIFEKEDSFFQTGYVVKYDPKAKPGEEYSVDHVGTDMTVKTAVLQTSYPEELKFLPVGRIIYECDADNDRLTAKQVLAEDSIPLCEAFGIAYYKLGEGKILAAPSPNKIFLMLDIADYEREKASGQWNKYHWLYFPTYVSAEAWQEFTKYLAANEGNISIFLCRVGFKNFNEALAIIEDWWFNHPEQATLTLQPQLGKAVTLDRSKPLRVLSKEEESGGRTSGFAKPLANILGDRILSLPEKAVGDALFAHLADMSRRYLANARGLELVGIIEAAFLKYGLKLRIDDRFDIMHGDPGKIAQVGTDEAARLKTEAGAEKKNFNTFFFSLAKAQNAGLLTLDQVKGILTMVLPQWKTNWACLDEIVFVEETLDGGRKRPEGALMAFSDKGDVKPLVARFKFRPSGTDQLKSKAYLDAEAMTPAVKEEIEAAFNGIKHKDLYKVLDRFGIAYAEERPPETDGIGLEPI